MILSYNNWKRLIESTEPSAGLTNSYFEWQQFPESSNMNTILQEVIDLITSNFPEATVRALNIEIPNPEDPSNSIDLKLLTRSTTRNHSLQPYYLFNNALKELNVYSTKGKNGVGEWILVRPEFADLSEEEFREVIINQILKTHNLEILSNIRAEIINLFLLISLNMEGIGEKDLREFSDSLVEAAIVKDSIEKIKSVPLKKIVVNPETLGSELAEGAESLLIDYSNLSEEQAQEAITNILSYFKRISQTTGGKDSKLSAIGNKIATRVLNHIDQYPEFKKKMIAEVFARD